MDEMRSQWIRQNMAVTVQSTVKINSTCFMLVPKTSVGTSGLYCHTAAAWKGPDTVQCFSKELKRNYKNVKTKFGILELGLINKGSIIDAHDSHDIQTRIFKLLAWPGLGAFHRTSEGATELPPVRQPSHHYLR